MEKIKKPAAFIVHTAPQRTRIAIPEKKRDTEYFMTLKRHYSLKPGVVLVRVNPTTGTALLIHESKESILDPKQTHELFNLEKEEMRKTVKKTVEEERAQAREADMMSSKILFGLSALQALRGEVLAPASSLFADALNFFQRTQKKDFDPFLNR